MLNVRRMAFASKIRNSFALSEVTVEDRADAPGLTIAEDEDSAVIGEQEVDFLQGLLGRFLCIELVRCHSCEGEGLTG